MKQILIGIVALVLIGIAGFLYRAALEHKTAPIAPGGGVACTDEAKICPDGSGVGRSAPDCAFAPCAFPNVEAADYGIAFALPAGYVADENAAGADPSMVGAFVKSATTTTALQTIIIHDYQIPTGTTSAAVILAHTRLQPSDMQPADMKSFTSRTIGTNTFSEITTERFEGVVSTSYFLPRKTDVLEFDISEHAVQNWSDSKLVVSTLPEHAAVLKMLATLELTKQ